MKPLDRTSDSVPAALSAADVERFRRDGYLGPYTLCSPDEMAALRPAIERVLETDPPASHNRVHNRHLDSRAVYDLTTDPAIVARMVALYGPDLLLWRTNFFVKSRGSKAIPWHQDFHYWPLEPPVIISAWIAVDPSTRQNGNLQVIPGSHRTIVPHVEATPDMQFKVMADAGCYDPGDLIDLEMQPGEFILFNERTLHHSEPNHSDLRRIGLAVRAIIPIVKVLEYDSPDHALQIIHGTDTMSLNRLAPPPAAKTILEDPLPEKGALPERVETGASIDRYIQAGKERKRHNKDRDRNLSETMQEALYDDQGLPK